MGLWKSSEQVADIFILIEYLINAKIGVRSFSDIWQKWFHLIPQGFTHWNMMKDGYLLLKINDFDDWELDFENIF